LRIAVVADGQIQGYRFTVQDNLNALNGVPLSSGSVDSANSNSYRKANAYESLFKAVTPAELGLLTSDPDLSLALQARFEQLCAPRPPDPSVRKDDIVVPRPTSEFGMFFAKRIGFSPPDWWVRGFRDSLRRDEFDLLEPPSGNLEPPFAQVSSILFLAPAVRGDPGPR
jgi:hypothetical protein